MEFDDVINEHLELRRSNARLEQSLPIEGYRADLAARNQPRQPERLLEETGEFSPDWPAESEPDTNRDADTSRLWGVPPLFDWGE